MKIDESVIGLVTLVQSWIYMYVTEIGFITP